MKTQDVKNKFIELRAKCLSYDKIAVQLHVSKQTLINWGKEFNKTINDIKTSELEGLREKYYLQKHRRIELFGEEILRIKKEISHRNLRKVPTHRLYDLLIRIYSLFDKEHKDSFEIDRIIAYAKRLESTLGKPDEVPICMVFHKTDMSHYPKAKDGGAVEISIWDPSQKVSDEDIEDIVKRLNQK